MDIFGVFTGIGGLALFLYGMGIMGDSLAKLSGGKMETVLERLTSTKMKAVIFGAIVTAVIQSSSATTVMVVGFVNSGIMQLGQAVGIIMGARYWDVPGQEMLEGPQCGTERTALEEGELPLLPASQAGGQLLGHAFPARGLGPRAVVDILGCCTALAQGLGQGVGLEHGAVVGLTMERYDAYLHGVFFLKNCGTACT